MTGACGIGRSSCIDCREILLINGRLSPKDDRFEFGSLDFGGFGISVARARSNSLQIKFSHISKTILWWLAVCRRFKQNVVQFQTIILEGFFLAFSKSNSTERNERRVKRVADRDTKFPTRVTNQGTDEKAAWLVAQSTPICGWRCTLKVYWISSQASVTGIRPRRGRQRRSRVMSTGTRARGRAGRSWSRRAKTSADRSNYTGYRYRASGRVLAAIRRRPRNTRPLDCQQELREPSLHATRERCVDPLVEPSPLWIVTWKTCN